MKPVALAQLNDVPDPNNRESLTFETGARWGLFEDANGALHIFDRKRRLHMRVGSALIRRLEYPGFADPGEVAATVPPPPPPPAPAGPGPTKTAPQQPWKGGGRR